MAALTVDPPAAAVPAAGGSSTHQLTNPGATKLAFKVKSSNNNEYRLKPVFGFVEPGASAPLEITRLAGAPKEDKLVIQFAEAGENTDAQAVFKAGPAAGEVVLPISAT
ncbi:Major sperm protein [Aphelenchoides bicaudatus]|nr:Major sperm protein [Aphelenchoides bicaudatus]KAI6190562.1 Major sperm protein [Aphelenchoides bicaudatus]